jgi:hypothetical protein
MSISFNPSDMDLTPVNLYWTPHGVTAASGEVYLGGTLGNNKVSIASEKADIKADQYGSTPLDKRVSGHKFMISTNITQVKDFQLASYLFPNATLKGTGPFDGSSASAAIEWVNAVGNSDLSVAGKLRMHPQNLPASVVNYDMTFFVACPTEVSEITHGPATQSQWKVEWTVYPDTSVSPARFMQYGDITL